MEDTQDKVRRNVVTLSALIVLFWYLNLSLSDFSRFIEPFSTKLSPAKFWFATTSLLIYMFLRYRFDAGTNEQIQEIAGEISGFHRSFMEPRLVRVVTGMLGNPRQMPLTSEIQLSDALVNAQSFSLSQLLAVDQPKQEKIKATLLQPKLRGRIGAVQFSQVLTHHQQDQVQAIYINCEYRMPRRLYVAMMCRVMGQLLFYSKSSVDVLVPFVLTATAFIICAFKLSNAI